METNQAPKRKVTKIIKITKSSNPLLWYSKYIGAEFKVVRFEQSKQRKLTAWVVEPDPTHRFINWVAEGDYEILDKSTKCVS